MQSSSPNHPSGTNTAVEIMGNQVRRSLKPWSGATFDLLSRLRASGCRAVPLPLERTPDAGVYELIPGKVILRPWPEAFTASTASTAFMRDLGKALRLIHEASRRLLKETAFDFPWGPPPVTPGQGGEPEEEQHVIFHGDLGPWNAVMDEEGAFQGLIDWDLARLGPPVGDLAEAAYEFGPLRLASQKQEGVFLPPELIRRRVTALLESYGAEGYDFVKTAAHIPVYLEERAEEITALARKGVEPFLSFHRRGLDTDMRAEAAALLRAAKSGFS